LFRIKSKGNNEYTIKDLNIKVNHRWIYLSDKQYFSSKDIRKNIKNLIIETDNVKYKLKPKTEIVVKEQNKMFSVSPSEDKEIKTVELMSEQISEEITNKVKEMGSDIQDETKDNNLDNLSEKDIDEKISVEKIEVIGNNTLETINNVEEINKSVIELNKNITEEKVNESVVKTEENIKEQEKEINNMNKFINNNEEKKVKRGRPKKNNKEVI